MSNRYPNIVFVFADQWRAQAAGYMGNPQVRTPNLDALAQRSVDFRNAVAGCPVCSPCRASLLTGQFPHRHGVFVNDVHLADDAESLAKQFKHAGYDTAYIGKWHLDGRGRKNAIPPESRQGFAYWKVLECTHDYNHSEYYPDDETTPRAWDGYDAIAQTDDACAYIDDHAASDNPFLLVLSWGPPHAPYETAPQEFRDLYRAGDLHPPPNVPEEHAQQARELLAGYYAHCSALDACVGKLLDTLDNSGLADNTIFVFTSDHGDMLFSQGARKKQQPYEESVRVPFLLHYPPFGSRRVEFQIDAQDIMPTLLTLCDLPVPNSVDGRDLSGVVRGDEPVLPDEVLLACYVPFGQWHRGVGGREYRGLRTDRYTYARSLDGPWLLFDNQTDPFQQANLVDDPAHAETMVRLDKRLTARLEEVGDPFDDADTMLAEWGYLVDRSRTTPTADFPEQVDPDRYHPVQYWQVRKQ